MESIKKRCPNFTFDDMKKLVELVQSNSILLDKRTDGATNKSKEIAWQKIYNSFNAACNTHRPLDGLKKKWNTLKSTAKTYKCKQGVSITDTGGGPQDIKIDPVLEVVSDIVGKGGISGVKDNNFTFLNDSIDINSEPECVAEEEEHTVSNEVEKVVEVKNTSKVENATQCCFTSSNESRTSGGTKCTQSRRKPFLPRTNTLEAKRIKYEETKILAIENEDKRAEELHVLKKKTLEQEVVLRDLIIEKLRNNEPCDEKWITLFKN